MNDRGPAFPFEQARRAAQLSRTELWWAYFGLGGNATPLQLRDFLTGATRPGRPDHDRLAQALNERFSEIGLDSPIPYFDQPPTTTDP